MLKTVGCQLSIFLKKNGKKIFNSLTRNGVSLDWREPECNPAGTCTVV